MVRLIAVAGCFLACFVYARCQTPTQSTAECIDGPSTWYRGSRSQTASGRTCQRWDTDKPHKPKYIPKDGGAHNYCRNPDQDLRGTWCYTTDNATRWEYCNISKCPDDSLVIWTNYDSSSQSTRLLRVQADPEIVKRETDKEGTFNVTVLTGSNRSLTEYWALAANYQNKLLYFSDYRSEYVGVWKMDEKKSKKHLEGMAYGIECIAYDWKTNNIYWTDSKYNWVMVADQSFKYYAPIYRTAPDPAHGLAVHSVKRLLIFSTYKALGSRIMVSDLAGKNAKPLFKFPDVFDVTGITIDYTDDRMYWTDYTKYGGLLMSSRLDGTNKTQHYYRAGAIFWGVAAYLDYLYVTDVYARRTTVGSQFFVVWIITKQSEQQRKVYRYTLSGKPRGIAVYSHNEEFSMDSAPSAIGECDEAHGCDHICLPRINAARECVCSLGYHLDPNTKSCQTKLVSDDYLLLADAGQGKVFQIPITDSNAARNASMKYSIIPLGHKWKAETVTVDQNANLYWSDKNQSTLSKSPADGGAYTKVTSSYANSIIVDPLTGNLFYSDNERDTIMVAKDDGSHIRTIVKPDPSKGNATSIRMITQDLKYNFIYWTDTFSKEGEGKVLRCRYDGTGKEVVLDKLNWPHAITIDYKTNRLYVAEAKEAVIYQIELSSLTTINNTSPKQKHYKQYDVSAYTTRVTHYIIDLKIHNGFAYVMDGKSSRLERFNLTEGARSMAPYGPAEFFRVTTVSVFSKTFYSTYTKTHKNPCIGQYCRQMCIALSNTRSKCLCEDGKKAIGNVCVDEHSVSTDITPPVPLTCPDNVELVLPTCSATVIYAWNEPDWTDDNSPTSDLVISRPSRSSPTRLPAGMHFFSYAAKDTSGNFGYCRFSVTVRDNQCSPAPNARPGMQKTVETCGNRVGSSFNVTCITEGYVIWVAQNGFYTQVPSYVVYCSKEKGWKSEMTTNSDCRPPPTVPQTTRGTVISTTKKQAITSSNPTAKSVATTTTTKLSTTTNTAVGLKNAAGKSEVSGGISGAVAAAIAVVVVVLVVVIALVVFFTLRNRPDWAVTKFSFPVFRKSSDGGGAKMESSNNAYESMT